MLVNQIFSFVKKVTLTFVIGSFLVMSLMFPALANPSSPTKGEANLNDIQAKTDQLAKQDPPSLKDIQARTGKGGINEVQGTADKDKMISPKDAKDNTTIEEQIKDFLGKD